MTVCIALMCDWRYDEEIGKAILTASDREITAGDVEYEPNQQKLSMLAPNVMLLIAGDYSIHTAAIYDTRRRLLAQGRTGPSAAAEAYASSIREAKQRQAENIYLAPMGLTIDTFHSRQREFSPEFVDRISNQLQQHQGADVEALIVGVENNIAHIYMVDSSCQVTCHDDVGFAAIGIGAWHAKSALMQARYTNNFVLAPAFATLFIAKKRAEIAPGVGVTTDYHWITRRGWSPIVQGLIDKAHEIYKDYEKKNIEWVKEAVDKLNDALRPPSSPEKQLEHSVQENQGPPSSNVATSSSDQT